MGPRRPACPWSLVPARYLFALFVMLMSLPALPASALQTQRGASPPEIPLPPPPPVNPPPGFTLAETVRARIYVEQGADGHVETFVVSWGPHIDEALRQLAAFLPPPRAMVDVYVYSSEASFAQAVATAPWPEPGPVDVLANPGIGEVAVNLPAFSRRTPLEAENALRHALAHVAAREASGGQIPRGFDEGLAAYFETPVAANLARHAALVQNARTGGDLISWSDLNRPAPPDATPAALTAHAYAMVAFLIDRHGPGVLGEFMTRLADEPDWRAELRDVYGRSPDELEAQWEENLPRWTTGGWRTNLLAAFNLQPARDLLAQGHYATARRELEQSLRLFTNLDDEEGIAEANALLDQVDRGLQAETFMSQAQTSLELHDYDRALTLVEQARGQYDRITGAREPVDLLATYEALAQAGLQAERDLVRARQQSLRWADYPMAREAALAAGGGYAWLGDDEGLRQTREVIDALDARQRRLVLLFGGLAIFSGGWLALWLWARGETGLDWGP